MRPVHWVAIVVGASAAAWGLTMLFGPRQDAGTGAGMDGAGPGLIPVRGGPQVEIMPGARPRDARVGTPQAGVMKSPEATEADRRREALREVLSRLENAPVYVEGVDGPAPAPTPKPTVKTPPGR